MLVDTVIVSKDGACANVAVFTDSGISDIGQVRNLRASTDACILGLNKGTDFATST